jgi:hypothetical protein
MKLGRALIVAAAGAVLLAFAAPAHAQRHGPGGVSGAAWHGNPGSGWRGQPWGWHGQPWGWHGNTWGWRGNPWGWRGYPWRGWHGNVAFVGGFYGYPFWGWGYPYGYPPYGYGYNAYPPPQYYSGGQEQVYNGHVVRRQTDSKDFSAPNQ